MRHSISLIEVPLDFQEKNFNNSKMKDNMWITAEPLYRNITVEWEKLLGLFKSDYRQLSPFMYKNNIKLGENWSNQNQNLLILDVDDGLKISDAIELFSKYTFLIYTTKSHQTEKKGVKCDRFRIIFPATSVPKGDDYFIFTGALESKYPFIDKQVNNKTGAFLGNFNCEVFTNAGMNFDCKELFEKGMRLKEIDKMPNSPKVNFKAPIPQRNNNSEEIDVSNIKSRLTREVVADIVSSCGFDINRKFMFKYRADERTPSASVSPDLLIKDFGSDLSTDAIGFVMETKQMPFVEAVNYVEQFTGRLKDGND